MPNPCSEVADKTIQHVQTLLSNDKYGHKKTADLVGQPLL